MGKDQKLVRKSGKLDIKSNSTKRSSMKIAKKTKNFGESLASGLELKKKSLTDLREQRKRDIGVTLKAGNEKDHQTTEILAKGKKDVEKSEEEYKKIEASFYESSGDLENVDKIEMSATKFMEISESSIKSIIAFKGALENEVQGPEESSKRS